MIHIVIIILYQWLIKNEYILKLEYALNAQWTIINRINGFSILGITEINGNNNINALFTLNKSTNDSFYISESTIRCLERFNNSVFKAYCYIESCRIIYFDRYILRFNEMIESCRIIHGLFYILYSKSAQFIYHYKFRCYIYYFIYIKNLYLLFLDYIWFLFQHYLIYTIHYILPY